MLALNQAGPGRPMLVLEAYMREYPDVRTVDFWIDHQAGCDGGTARVECNCGPTIRIVAKKTQRPSQRP
jgi:hypothetical protein